MVTLIYNSPSAEHLCPSNPPEVHKPTLVNIPLINQSLHVQIQDPSHIKHLY